MATQLEQALEGFLHSGDFKEGVISSTKASWGGSAYSVELFPDGSHRVLWDNQIGNKYNSDGVILGIPTLSGDLDECLSDGEADEEECFSLVFDNEEDEIAQSLREALE